MRGMRFERMNSLQEWILSPSESAGFSDLPRVSALKSRADILHAAETGIIIILML